MIIFGWFCLAALAVFVTLGAVAMLNLSLGFSGKAGGECLFFALLAVGLWFLVYWNFPFVLEVKP